MRLTTFLTVFYIFSFLLVPFSMYAGGYVTAGTFKCPEANQGVAVDESYFYGIGNQTIVKCTLDGEVVARWHEKDPSLIKHFDGGSVIDGYHYCSHSNYPEVPMASSVEVFDTKNLTHIKTISLGIESGSCTWVVKGDGCWYLGFAHYDRSGGGAGGEVLKDASWTQIVRYDDEWHRTQAWILPKELVDQLRPNSISGCLFANGKFYCTGHDAKSIRAQVL